MHKLFAVLTLAALSHAAKNHIDVNGVKDWHREFNVVGYVPSYRHNSLDWDSVSQHLTHVVLTAIEVNADGSLSSLDRLPSIDNDVWTDIRSQTRANNCKVLVSVGGFGRSAGFRKLVHDKEAKGMFVQNLLGLFNLMDLDGVEINWEYPVSENDWDGLFELLIDLHKAFDEKGYLVALPIYPGQEGLLSPDSVNENVDMVLLHAYDEQTSAPSRHSTFDFAKKIEKKAQSSLTASAKLVLVVPFFGRDMHDSMSGYSQGYSSLQQEFGPLSLDQDEAGTIYFNGPDTVYKKTRWAYLNGLGGVAGWEIGQDLPATHPASLLATISRAHTDAVNGGEAEYLLPSELDSKLASESSAEASAHDEL